MAKTKEELEKFKKECSELSKKMKELTPEEMKEVSGGKTWAYLLALASIKNESAEFTRNFIIYHMSEIVPNDLENLKQEFFKQYGIELVLD